MKAKILSENILKALVRVGRLVSPRPQVPSLGFIKITAQKDGIEITASNIEMTETSWIGGKIEEEGEVCVPAKTFTEFITSLPHDTVLIETEKETINISSGGFFAKLPTLNTKEFPETATVDKKNMVAIEKEHLLKTLLSVLFSAATDEGRPILTGVKIMKQDQKTIFAATDGYRLSVKQANITLASLTDVVIPAKALSEIVKLMQEEKEEKNVYFGSTGENQVAFSVGDSVFVTRLLDGEYPNFERIIPTLHTARAVIEKDQFLKAVKSAAIFARDNANIIKIILTENTATVAANAPQTGENKVEFSIQLEGEGGEIAFNSRFLIDFLLNASGDEIVFEMTGSLNPGVFKSPTDESWLHIIMPVRVQS